MQPELMPGPLLIVDDNEFVRSALQRFFKFHFAPVLVASTADEAEALMRAERPTHVLCDFNLGPNQPTGAMLIERWRREQRQLVCVVLVSGESPRDIGDVPGADAVFTKPPNLPDLLGYLLGRRTE
jgi:CheY-like chemotaxis protein